MTGPREITISTDCSDRQWRDFMAELDRRVEQNIRRQFGLYPTPKRVLQKRFGLWEWTEVAD